jgi:predicted RND superfamily exporter protein
MDTYLISSQSTSLLSLVAALFVTFLITVRSLTLSVIGLIVNVLPTMAILGLMSWLGVKIDMATTLIGGITMGIAVDDTLHFLWHYQQAIRGGRPAIEALRETVRHKGVAIISTAVLLIGGFMVMALSDFYPVANFGIFTSLTLFLGVAVEILLLPVLLTLRRQPASLENSRTASRIVCEQVEKVPTTACRR